MTTCVSEWRFRVNSTISRDVSADPSARRVAEVFGLRPVFAGDDAKPAIVHRETLYDDFELTLRPGQITAVVGPSGAGKSVLLRLAAARLPNTIQLCPDRLARSVMPPVAILKGGSLEDRLAVLSQCGLAEAAVLITPAKRLSGGQLYRLALAQACWSAIRTSRPAVIIADEFAATLDALTASSLCRQIRRLIGRTKISLLLASPRMELLEPLQPDQIILKPLGQRPKLIASKHDLSLKHGRCSWHGRPAHASQGHLAPAASSVASVSVSSSSSSATKQQKEETTTTGETPVRRMGGTPMPLTTPMPQTAADSIFGDPALWVIQRGAIGDYRQLADFHYIAGPPAAHKRVYVIRPPKGRGWERQITPPVAAVLVVSPPLGCVASRNVATDGRYVSPRRRDDLALLNAEMECISRVVVHPIFRGLGLAVRLVRHALADARTPWMESLAVMGQINPFFERAGMTPYRKADDDGSEYVYYLAETGTRE